MEEKGKNCQSTITLPDHVISELILPKLPVKALLRFKSVSKDWFSLISSTTFIKTHLEFSSSARNEFLLLTNCNFFTLSYDEHGLIELSSLSNDEVYKLGRYQVVVGCCNGLICIYIFDNYFVIWNPAIRVYNEVTLPPDIKRGLPRRFYGFGHASVDDDYIIVCISQAWYNDCWVFSLKQGKWKIVDLKPKYVVQRNSWSGVCVDDTLYWINSNADQQGSILSYNLANEEFKVVPGCEDWVGHGARLCVIRGCLALRCYGKFGTSEDVWIRKRKGDIISGSWEWEKAFDIHKKIAVDENLGFSHTGKCLVQKSKGSWVKLKLLDPTTGESAQFKCNGGKYRYEGVWGGKHYYQSLISPFAIED